MEGVGRRHWTLSFLCAFLAVGAELLSVLRCAGLCRACCRRKRGASGRDKSGAQSHPSQKAVSDWLFGVPASSLLMWLWCGCGCACCLWVCPCVNAARL